MQIQLWQTLPSQNVDIPITLGIKAQCLTMRGSKYFLLLLPRKSMKKTDMLLDFKNSNVMIYTESIQLTVTKSGHNAIPISRYSIILSNVTTGVNKNVTLLASDTNKSKYDITQAVSANIPRQVNKVTQICREKLRRGCLT